MRGCGIHRIKRGERRSQLLQTYRQLKEQRDKTCLQKFTSSDAAAPSVHSGSPG